MNESKLAIGAFGFAADVILVITLTPTAKERVMTAAVPAIPSPVYSAPAPAGAPLSPDPDEDKSLEPITEACIKGGSPYVPPCGKVWRAMERLDDSASAAK